MQGKYTKHYSEQEAAQRRDAVIKRMLSMPPKPHAEMKIGKPRRKMASSVAPAKPRKRGPAV
jgi:hypothetical protein